jgi:hypothetical protein
MTTSTSFAPRFALVAAAASALCAIAVPAFGSSHREAPFISTAPKVDGTDFYMFNSYEGVGNNGTGGRAGYVTLIANYQPLQDAYGGPNYFKLDPNALYEIHIDNTGDAKEDITFQFRFKNTLKNFKGLDDASKGQSIPLVATGKITAVADTKLNVVETYDLSVVRGDRRTGTRSAVGAFTKPVDYIGTKTNGSPAEYEAYAQLHIAEFSVPGCSTSSKAKVFVGQRQEGFAVNLGTIFDLVNAPLSALTSPRGDGTANTIGDKNVTSLALEVPVECLASAGSPIIGGWTTASLPQASVLSAAPKSGHQTTQSGGGAWVQVSRLGSPLVNEVVIGLKDKDRFNGSIPSKDGQFAAYVTNPTLPALVSAVLAETGNTTVAAPTFVRNDLVAAFLTGVPGVNKPANVTASEMLRLNTGLKAVPANLQNPLGLVGGVLAQGTVAAAVAAQGDAMNPSDLAGFPNGRRPKDDVVDIALIAVMGGLCSQPVIDAGVVLDEVNCKPSNVFLANGDFVDGDGVPTVLKLTDKADQEKAIFLSGFPYLNTPNGGTSAK